MDSKPTTHKQTDKRINSYFYMCKQQNKTQTTQKDISPLLITPFSLITPFTFIYMIDVIGQGFRKFTFCFSFEDRTMWKTGF